MIHLRIHTDGGARGNPGPAAIGVVIKKINQETNRENTLVSFGKKIGECTNNVAEYSAVIGAFDWLLTNLTEQDEKDLKIDFFLDSKLVAMQLSGIFKIKDPHLRELLFLIRRKEAEVGGSISYQHIAREKNQEADLEVNKALDS